MLNVVMMNVVAPKINYIKFSTNFNLKKISGSAKPYANEITPGYEVQVSKKYFDRVIIFLIA